MNTTTPPDPDDARLDEWINQNLASLTAALDAVVDVEAGLRDARVPDRVRSLDTAVDTVLDIDAGLRAILPPVSRPHRAEPRTHTDAGPAVPETVSELAEILLRRSPLQRLRLRSVLPLTELRLIRHLCVAYRGARELGSRLDAVAGAGGDVFANVFPEVFAEVFAQILADARAFVHALARTRTARVSERRARDDALAVAVVLASHLARARDLTRVLTGDDENLSAADQRHASAFYHAVNYNSRIAGARGFADIHVAAARILAASILRPLEDALALTRDHDLVVLRARTRAYARAFADSRALPLNLTRALTRGLGLALEDARGTRVRGGRVRAHALTDLIDGIAAVDAAVTDFATVDLTDLDLSTVDLRGVRWSIVTTRWPAAWRQIIQDRSVPVDPDRHPELYEIRDDPRIHDTVT